eukprot:gene5058-7060_t
MSLEFQSQFTSQHIDYMISSLMLNNEEIRDLEVAIDWVKQTLIVGFGASSYMTGAAFCNVIIPLEPVAVTQIVPKKQFQNWCLFAHVAVGSEAAKIYSRESCPVTSVAIPPNNVVLANIMNKPFVLSPNDVSNLLLSAIIEEFDTIVVKRDHLFKKSFILIKTWCYYESNSFGIVGLQKVFNHEAITVMTLSLFVKALNDTITSPLEALFKFLCYFAEFDWKNNAVDARENISLSSDAPSEFGLLLEEIFDKYDKMFFKVTDNGCVDCSTNSAPTTTGKVEDDSNDDRKSEDAKEFMFSRKNMKNLSGSIDKYQLNVVDPFLTFKNLVNISPSTSPGGIDMDLIIDCLVKGKIACSELMSVITSDAATSDVIIEEFSKFFHYTTIIANSRYGSIGGYGFVDNLSQKGQSNVIINETSNIFSSSSDRFVSNVHLIDGYLKHCETILSEKVQENTLLNLTLQVLNQHGPTPIGEVGKQLQVITGNPGLLRDLKKEYFGLKKFLLTYPEIFVVGNDHDFNPTISIVDKFHRVG